jgi:hypothetical protein
MTERIERDGMFIGSIEPYFKPLTHGRGFVKQPIYWAILPNGKRTEFTLPNRKQAIEWLEQATRIKERIADGAVAMPAHVHQLVREELL